MPKIDPPWRAEPIPAPGWKVVSDDGVDLVWVYAETETIVGTSRPKLSAKQAEWLAALIVDLPNMVRLDPDLVEVLERYRAERPDLGSTGAAASYLLRDALIGLGLLPLGERNRSRGAQRTAKRP